MKAIVLFAVALTACGVDQVGLDGTSSAVGAPIINGTPSSATDFPAVGVLLMHIDDNFFGEMASMACTGTLIAPDTVLLASHCVDPVSFYGMQPEFHFSFSHDVSAYGTGTPPFALPPNTYAVTSSVMHPDWSMNALDSSVDGPGTYYDVALAFLGAEVTDRTPAMVVGPEDSSGIIVGAAVDIVGYGSRDYDYDPYGENDASVKYQAVSVINEVGTTEMQIGNRNPVPQKCHGDSGGPSFLDYDDDMLPVKRLVGVTSHSYDQTDCQRGGIDTRVDAYRDWIESTMIAACTSGKRLSCASGGGLPVPMNNVSDGGPISDGGSISDDGGTVHPTGGGYYASQKNDDCSQTGTSLWAGLLAMALLARLRHRG
ncbi:MAG: hypothetical protein A2289_24225 [Deltaproteobacteria bacterium RIFOXYA12_FULL_58_15]|nr:MAG: hypothetical protein A2289_24225 [Deltaproteobacteria bacterium RIFOXYA12_FULL_58_15]OGR10134.1 MAG: hypothetical protein A2341_05995 [Deltaproteobacteria bacterium RIFOXYB12_FULL_58_9]